MRINNAEIISSSFLSMDKDYSIIFDKIMSNERIKKLLYYPTKTPLDRPNLSQEETNSLFGKYIKIVPKLEVDKDVRTYMIINFSDFITNAKNPEFRDCNISFDIICHYDQWQLDNFQLRPYRIAAEIDQMLNNKRLTGMGKLHFIGATNVGLTDEFGGLTMIYRTIHGGEDKFNALTDEQEEELFE